MVEQKSENMIERVVFALFLLLVFSLGLMKPAVSVSFATLTPTDLVFPVLFLVWIVAIASRQMKFVWHPAYVAFVVYFFTLALSAAFSSQPGISRVKLAGELYLILLPVVAVNIVNDVTRLRTTLYAWVAGAVIPMLIGLLGITLYYYSPDTGLLRQITYHYGAVPVGDFPRINSTFVSPSMFCNYLTVTFAIVAACHWINWIRTRTAVLLMASLILCVVFTVSIAIGGALLAGGLIVWLFRSEPIARALGLVVALLNALAFLLIAPFALGSAPSGRFSVNLNPSSRLLVWSDAWNRFLENPVVGSGIGTAVASVTFQNTDGSWSILTDAHNMFLNVAGQAGSIGLAGLLLLTVELLRIAFSRKTGDLRSISFALAVAFVAAFLYDGLTGSFEDARHLWVLIGLILAVSSIERPACFDPHRRCKRT